MLKQLENNVKSYYTIFLKMIVKKNQKQMNFQKKQYEYHKEGYSLIKKLKMEINEK